MNLIDHNKRNRYPTIRVSQCRHFDSNVQLYGVHYCPECNSIILPMALFPKKEAEELIVEVLNHETTHWWLCRNVNEEASADYDAICDHEEASKPPMKNIALSFLE